MNTSHLTKSSSSSAVQSDSPTYWSCSCKKTTVTEPQKVRLIAIRHGESEHNIKGVVNGNPGADFHLTEKGKAQAEALADTLADRKEIKAIIASEMHRTQETASPLANRLHIQIQIDSRLDDVNPGALEGIPIKEFRERTDNSKKSILGSETNIEMAQRIKDFLNDIVECYKGQTIVVISSEIVLHSLLQIAHGEASDEDKGEHLKNGVIYEVDLQSSLCCPTCGDRCAV